MKRYWPYVLGAVVVLLLIALATRKHPVTDRPATSLRPVAPARRSIAASRVRSTKTW